MKHKLTKETLAKIIESEANFRPRSLTAKIVKIDADTINHWIKEGMRLLKEQTILFSLKKENFDNFSEEEKLMFLAEKIQDIQTISQTISWDNYMNTGKKEQLKMFLTKETIIQSPENTVEIAIAGVHLFEKNEDKNPSNPNKKKTILSQDEIKQIEEKLKKG